MVWVNSARDLICGTAATTRHPVAFQTAVGWIRWQALPAAWASKPGGVRLERIVRPAARPVWNETRGRMLNVKRKQDGRVYKRIDEACSVAMLGLKRRDKRGTKADFQRFPKKAPPRTTGGELEFLSRSRSTQPHKFDCECGHKTAGLSGTVRGYIPPWGSKVTS